MDKSATKQNITPISGKTDEPQTHELSRLELIAVKGLQAQMVALDEYVAAKKVAINEQSRELSLAICERLGLPLDAIGTTHLCDFNRGVVYPKPADPESPPIPVEPPPTQPAQAG